MSEEIINKNELKKFIQEIAEVVAFRMLQNTTVDRGNLWVRNSDLNIKASVRTDRILRENGITDMLMLCETNLHDLMKVKGFGVNCLRECERLIDDYINPKHDEDAEINFDKLWDI